MKHHLKQQMLILHLYVLSPADLSTNHDALLLQQQICCSLLDPLLEVAEASFCTQDVAVEASVLMVKACLKAFTFS